jgi:hypothetical protein
MQNAVSAIRMAANLSAGSALVSALAYSATEVFLWAAPEDIASHAPGNRGLLWAAIAFTLAYICLRQAVASSSR